MIKAKDGNMIKKLTCICCPLGCPLNAEIESGNVVSITGNTCPRGEKYGREELTAPQRMLTTTVRITNGILPMLPVVSQKALPKAKLYDCMEVLRKIQVAAPIKAGQVIVHDILGLGVDIVASRDM